MKMKFSIFLLVLNFFSFVHLKVTVENPQKGSRLVFAVKNVLENVWKKETANLIIPKVDSNFLIKDFQQEFLSESFSSAKIVFRQEVAGKISLNVNRKKLRSIFVIETFEDFMEIYEKLILSKQFKFSGFFIIVMINGEIKEIEEIFSLLWQLQIFNVNAMFENENGEILVKTTLPFSRGNCNSTKPILINRFKNGKFENGIENFFPEKMKNLHGCEVKVTVSNESKPLVNVEYFDNGKFELSGQDIDLIKTISKSLNFKINRTFISGDGFFMENGFAKGPLKAILIGTADLSISSLMLQLHIIAIKSFLLFHLEEILRL
jgi:hypothetical protein